MNCSLQANKNSLFYTVVIFNMSTGVKLLTMTASHVEFTFTALQIIHRYVVHKIVVEN